MSDTPDKATLGTSFISAKRDTRPMRAGWAPGDYYQVCRECRQHFVGAKRCGCCADCAYAKPDAVLVGPQSDVAGPVDLSRETSATATMLRNAQQQLSHVEDNWRAQVRVSADLREANKRLVASRKLVMDLYRWIPVTERLPTAEDGRASGPHQGDVEWCTRDHAFVGTWKRKQLPELMCPATHWRRLILPPDPEAQLCDI